MKSETRLRRAIDHARVCIDTPPDERRPRVSSKGPRPGLGTPHDFSTRRVALAPCLSQTLVHPPTGGRGLPDLVDPSTLEFIDTLEAVARELTKGGPLELLRWLRARAPGSRDA